MEAPSATVFGSQWFLVAVLDTSFSQNRWNKRMDVVHETRKYKNGIVLEMVGSGVAVSHILRSFFQIIFMIRVVVLVLPLSLRSYR